MQIITPKYYNKFKCIAEKCKHSCCIGWEIDIDKETLEIYKNISGELGARLKNGISLEGGTPHFITDKSGRCPFLNQNGLCDIISTLGEDGLCQICYDHPRFRNFFSDRIELGLGLCCEAAAELILKGEDKFNLMVLESYGENEPVNEEDSTRFKNRDELFSILSNRALPLINRMKQAAELYNLPTPTPDIRATLNAYRTLERLDPHWDDLLNTAYEKNCSAEYILTQAEKKIPLPTEKLLCYFIYRYFASAENSHGAVKFALQGTFLCLAVCLSYYSELNFENFSEICRIFSLETEYSEENVVLLLKG